MNLFDDIERDYHLPKNESESSFEFFNRSARPAIERIRDKIEAWLTEYPSEHQEELVARLRTDFDSPWYELFLHQTFLHMGASLEIHPDVGDRNKRPEFLVTLDRQKLIVEATLFKEESTQEKNRNQRLAYVYDEINKLDIPFFLNVRNVSCPSGYQFSPKRIKAFLERELSKIDPDDLLIDYRYDKSPNLKFINGSAYIEFRVLPKSKDSRQKKTRAIGMKSSGTGMTFGTSEKRLRKALQAKGKRYGKLGLPYLIAANTLGHIAFDEEDLRGALFGTNQEYVPAGSSSCQIRNLDDGLWGTAENPKYTRVSGVLLGMALPWNIPRMNLSIYKNPWAEFPLPEFDWPVPIYDRVDKSFEVQPPTARLGTLFCMEKDWPGDFFPRNQ